MYESITQVEQQSTRHEKNQTGMCWNAEVTFSPFSPTSPFSPRGPGKPYRIKSKPKTINVTVAKSYWKKVRFHVLECSYEEKWHDQ